ncbi:MAG: hypothetical protein ACLUTU_02180 [Blautia faecis]
MKKKYKAVFFDWDGTAVLSRKAPVEEIVGAMRPLLDQKVNLVIVSGTTIENIAGENWRRILQRNSWRNCIWDLDAVPLITGMKMDRS